MKPKSKKIITPKDETGTQTTAIAPAAKHATVWDALDKATKELSAADCRYVQEQVSGIQSDLNVVFEKFDSIASRMLSLWKRVGKEVFATLANDVFPRFGLSRSKCYRMLDSAQEVAALIPHAQMRQALVSRFERSLTTTDSKGAVHLIPGFEKAIKAIKESGGEPKPASDGTYSPEQVDEYTGRIITLTRKLGKTEQKSKAQKEADARERIIDAFSRYMEAYGTEKSENLVGELDKMVSEAVKTIEPSQPAQPKVVGGTAKAS